MTVCLSARRLGCVLWIASASAACAPRPHAPSLSEDPRSEEPVACFSGPDYAPPSGPRTVPLAFQLHVDLPGWLVLDRVCVLLDGARLLATVQDPGKQVSHAQFRSLMPIREGGAHLAVAYVWVHLPDFGPDGRGFPLDLKSEHRFRSEKESGLSIEARTAEKTSSAPLAERLAVSWRETPMP